MMRLNVQCTALCRYRKAAKCLSTQILARTVANELTCAARSDPKGFHTDPQTQRQCFVVVSHHESDRYETLAHAAQAAQAEAAYSQPAASGLS